MYTLSRYIRSRVRNILLAIAAFAAFAAACPVLAESFEIIVVKSAELKPYEEVLRGIRDSCDCTVRELRLQNGDGSEIILKRSPGAVIAIGSSAFKKVREIQSLPVIYTMVIPSETAGTSPNISGVSMDSDPVEAISLMMDMFPKAKRIGVLYDPRYTAAFVREALKTADAVGIELVVKQAHDKRDIPRLVDEMRNKIDVLWMLPDPTVITNTMVEYLLQFSFHYNVPIFSFATKYVEMGAVAALVVDPYTLGVQAGEMVKTLSAGRKDAIRVYARSPHLTINTKVAAKMGLKISDEILKRANKIE
jgi:putative tryptophan/tyrosine transport system substrate-binding protein